MGDDPLDAADRRRQPAGAIAIEDSYIDDVRLRRDAGEFAARARTVPRDRARDVRAMAARVARGTRVGEVDRCDDAGTVDSADDSLAPFSSWGTTDSIAKPDLVAPGRRIVSIRVPGSLLDTIFPDRIVYARNGAAYLRLSGTSMATAVASGAVALLLERYPALTPDQVKAALVGSARAYGAAPPHDPAATGSGLLDAIGASRAAAGMSTPQQQQVTAAGAAAVTGAVTTFQIRRPRPADAVARSMRRFLSRLPLRWRDPYLGGLSWGALTWDSVVWDSVAWDNYDWDSVAWDSVAWDESVAWDSVAWDSVAWDSVAWDESVAWDSSGFD